jgi:streptogramin lyase
MKNRIYFLILLCWFNSSIGQTVTTIAGVAGLSGSTDGTNYVNRFNSPTGLSVDVSGNVYVADAGNNAIRKITASGVSTIVRSMGSTDGSTSIAQFYDPRGITIDSSGNLYVADSGNRTIRKITTAGMVSTIAGYPGLTGTTDGTGSAARFYNPYGVTVDALGNVYVADTSNNAIRKITPAGVVTTLAGLAGVTTGGFVNGTGSAARFSSPSGVAVDALGNVYVADKGNNAIRKITAIGVVTTLAGAGPFAKGFVNGTGSAARFDYPSGVAVDASGNVFVADTDNNVIRKITVTGEVSSIAGNINGSSGSANGVGNAASFNRPNGIAIDNSGNVYVADSNNNTIRKITGIPLGNAKFELVSKLNIYPNPVTSLLQIQTSNNTTLDKVCIIDLTGKKVLEKTQNSSQIDVAHLANGMYIIEAFSGEEKFSSKFVKE